MSSLQIAHKAQIIRRSIFGHFSSEMPVFIDESPFLGPCPNPGLNFGSKAIEHYRQPLSSIYATGNHLLKCYTHCCSIESVLYTSGYCGAFGAVVE
jgi:hypothetical protein